MSPFSGSCLSSSSSSESERDRETKIQNRKIKEQFEKIHWFTPDAEVWGCFFGVNVSESPQTCHRLRWRVELSVRNWTRIHERRSLCGVHDGQISWNTERTLCEGGVGVTARERRTNSCDCDSLFSSSASWGRTLKSSSHVSIQANTKEMMGSRYPNAPWESSCTTRWNNRLKISNLFVF